MMRIATVVCFAGVLTACSGNTTSSDKDDGTATDMGGSGTGTGNSGAADNGAATSGTADNTASSPGAAVTTGSAAEDPANSTGATPTAGGTAQDTANATGSTPTGAGGTGQDAATTTDGDSSSECDERCDPCPEGQRRYDCTGTCLCESIDDSARDAQERLLTCDWESPCGGAGLSVTANAGSPIYNVSGLECLFSALRDGTPGRFDFSYAVYTGFVVEQTGYVILQDGSDTILVLSSGYNGGPAPTNAGQYFGVETCFPPADFVLDACLADPAGCSQFIDWLNLGTEATNTSCPGE